MGAFEFHVAGLEDAILAVLQQDLGTGVNAYALYSGELDSDNLKTALGALTPRFPLILVSYTEGEDKPDPPVGAVKNAPLHFRHDCSFTVICASNDARSENVRRRGKQAGGKKWLGVYQMVDRVRDALGGLQLAVTRDDGSEPFLLNHKPLHPAGVQHIARTAHVTAYAATFDTYFRYATADRRTAGKPVRNVALNVTAQPSGLLAANVPGVVSASDEPSVRSALGKVLARLAANATTLETIAESFAVGRESST